MRTVGFVAGAVFFALAGCAQTLTTELSGSASSTGQTRNTGSSGERGSTTGTSGGQSSGTSGTSDPCFGVTCTSPGAACFGGECKCGGPDGVLCSSPGESCSPLDNSCGPTASCAITPCPTNTVCNPADGTCHCGNKNGFTCPKDSACTLLAVDGGPLGPGEDGGGAPVYGVCSRGDPCEGVTCPPFEACDVNNGGTCECGGAPDLNMPGVVCTSDQACVNPFDGGTSTCMLTCQPFGVPCPALPVPDGGSIDQGCYYFPASRATVCARPTDDAGAGSDCQLPTDCAAPFTCGAGVLDAGDGATTCLSYCDIFPAGGPTSSPTPDGGTHACTPGNICTPLPPGIVAGTCEPG